MYLTYINRVEDSEHIGCKLLSLRNEYPPAFQMALDMFKRLGLYERIIETLLGDGLALEAFQFYRHNMIQYDPYRFFEVSLKQNNDVLFMEILYFWFQESKNEKSNKIKLLFLHECQIMN